VRLGALALVISVVWVGVREAPASARHRRKRHQPKTHKPKTLEFVDTASLSSDGRTADVVLLVLCKGFTPAPFRVTLEQNRVTGAASSGADYKCNGQRQRLVVPVTASSGAFKSGSAIVTGSANLHSSTGGVKRVSVSRSIQLA
jgi:hypothetical protein